MDTYISSYIMKNKDKEEVSFSRLSVDINHGKDAIILIASRRR